MLTTSPRCSSASAVIVAPGETISLSCDRWCGTLAARADVCRGEMPSTDLQLQAEGTRRGAACGHAPFSRPVRRRPGRCWPVALSLAGRTARGSRFILFLNIRSSRTGPSSAMPRPTRGSPRRPSRRWRAISPQPLPCGRDSPVSLGSPVTSPYASTMPAAGALRAKASNGSACSRGIDLGRFRRGFRRPGTRKSGAPNVGWRMTTARHPARSRAGRSVPMRAGSPSY